MGEILPVPTLRFKAWILDKTPHLQLQGAPTVKGKAPSPGVLPQSQQTRSILLQPPTAGLPHLQRRLDMDDPLKPKPRVTWSPRQPSCLCKAHLHVLSPRQASSSTSGARLGPQLPLEALGSVRSHSAFLQNGRELISLLAKFQL